MDSSQAKQHASMGKGGSRKTWLSCKRDGNDSACGILPGAVKRESVTTKYGGQKVLDEGEYIRDLFNVNYGIQPI